MTDAADARFMDLALALGRRGLGRVAPWPSVGCVIVRAGRIVGRGTSDPVSLRHAERVALDQAGQAAGGATVYVTLEPCAHHGRTPPCADALVAAGVARVVVATGDPNPLVAGQGLARLRAAGIAVDLGLRAAEARADQAGFLSVQERGRPFVTLKLATSFDGRIATASGESRWITGPEARRAVHALRARHDAVLVGAGTVRADDPALNVRGLGPVPQPRRVVLSRRLDIPEGRLVATENAGPLVLVHGAEAPDATVARWTGLGATCLACPVEAGELAPGPALAALAGVGLTRVFCEGGGTLAASLLAAGLVDEVVGVTAGLMIGAEGMPAIGALGLSALAEAPRFTLVETRALGGDVMHRWVRAQQF
ncbi:MAG: bifunctional diaminohydroxyphosphoribosylaminopyrimidine deaminase / 5-amino-6-(5-phosphoribosylamino)uracil reductase RibD [Rhodobacteraceae bacterium HLUCCA08]|nr:MAG: bifunctional diaminohydroxyphosphoribosylaminopyrimidine deaminase / 5-amino-6-(5-phosphoribosylamino)uracil reductase RibD [Rhodobacteraceae bacterium HLUCCA08]